MIQDFLRPRQHRAPTYLHPTLRLRAGKLIWVGAASAIAITSGASVLYNTTRASSTKTSSPSIKTTPDTQSGIAADDSLSTSSTATDTDSQGQDDASQGASINVHVNGTPVTIPQNGSTSQTITNSDGSKTEVNVESEQHNSGDMSHSSVHINSHASSHDSSTSMDTSIQSTH
jgi:hypothetical protein